MHKSQTGEGFWDSIKEDIIDLYVNKKWSTTMIGKKYNCDKCTIRYKLKEFGIEINKKRHNAKYELNVNYFDEINTEHKAYWLGFILADGHVGKSSLTISIHKDDGYLLDLFLKDIESNMKVKIIKDRYSSISICSEYLTNRLYEIGYNHRKSYYIDFDKIIKNVPNNLINHFIRGMFDGDGCIKYYSYPYLKKKQYHLGYTGLYNVCSYIKNTLNLSNRMIKEGEYTYTVVSRDPKTINEAFEFMYRDATIYI